MHALCRIADLSQKNYTVVINMFNLFKLFLKLSWYAFQLIFKCVLEMPIVVYLKSLEKFSFISIFLVCVCDSVLRMERIFGREWDCCRWGVGRREDVGGLENFS